jgi:hypothetical protein
LSTSISRPVAISAAAAVGTAAGEEKDGETTLPAQRRYHRRLAPLWTSKVVRCNQRHRRLWGSSAGEESRHSSEPSTAVSRRPRRGRTTGPQPSYLFPLLCSNLLDEAGARRRPSPGFFPPESRTDPETRRHGSSKSGGTKSHLDHADAASTSSPGKLLRPPGSQIPTTDTLFATVGEPTAHTHLFHTYIHAGDGDPGPPYPPAAEAADGGERDPRSRRRRRWKRELAPGFASFLL